MRVCHVITRLIIGGAQENTILTCEGLAERGWKVALLAGPETGPEGSLWKRARAGAYKCEEVPTLVRAVRPRTDKQCINELTTAFQNARPDIVHTHSSKAGVVARIAAHRAGVPIIVHTIHGMSFNRTQPWVTRAAYRALERYCGRRSHAIICVADAMAEQARAARITGDAVVRTIYSGIETERFAPSAASRSTARAAWGVSDDHVVIGTIARLFPNKGYEQLIDAMPAICDALPDARFVWVGDGAAREAYLRRLDIMKLRDRVHLAGLVLPDAVPKLIAGMDILVHLSQWEGLPRAVVQALLMQVPAVTFDNDGAPEVVEHGRTGEVVPLNNIDGVATAVCRLARDPAYREACGRRGRISVITRFDHRRMVEQIDALYRELMDANQ